MNRLQIGAHMVEFAVIAGVFFMSLFLVVEVARGVFAFNTLIEAARRGSRVAAVCPVNHTAIRDITAFGSASGDGAHLPGLSSANVTVDYLDEDGNVVPDPVANPTDIFFVRVRISGYQHRFIVPFLASVITAPTFAATLPSESLGAVPTAEGVAPIPAQCYGTTI